MSRGGRHRLFEKSVKREFWREKMKQVHLFDRSVVVERVTSLGTTVRLKLEPVGENKVKILEYHRKHKGKEGFKRVKAEEGVVLPFAQLNLSESYEDLFPLLKAA